MADAGEGSGAVAAAGASGNRAARPRRAKGRPSAPSATAPKGRTTAGKDGSTSGGGAPPAAGKPVGSDGSNAKAAASHGRAPTALRLPNFAALRGQGAPKHTQARRRGSVAYEESRRQHASKFISSRFFVVLAYHLLFPFSLPVVWAVEGYTFAQNLDMIPWDIDAGGFQWFVNQVVVPTALMGVNVFVMLQYTLGKAAARADGVATNIMLESAAGLSIAIVCLDVFYLARLSAIALKYASFTVAEWKSLHESQWSRQLRTSRLLSTWIQPPIDLVNLQLLLGAIDIGEAAESTSFVLYTSQGNFPFLKRALFPDNIPVLTEAGRDRVFSVAVPTGGTVVGVPGTLVAESMFLQVTHDHVDTVAASVRNANIAAVINVAAAMFTVRWSIAAAGDIVAAVMIGIMLLYYSQIVYLFEVCGVVEYSRRAALLQKLMSLLEEKRSVRIVAGLPWLHTWYSPVTTVYLNNVRSVWRLYRLLRHVGYQYRTRVQVMFYATAVVMVVFAVVVGYLLFFTEEFDPRGITAAFTLNFVFLAAALGLSLKEAIATNTAATKFTKVLLKAELRTREYAGRIAAGAGSATASREQQSQYAIADATAKQMRDAVLGGGSEGRQSMADIMTTRPGDRSKTKAPDSVAASVGTEQSTGNPLAAAAVAHLSADARGELARERELLMGHVAAMEAGADLGVVLRSVVDSHVTLKRLSLSRWESDMPVEPAEASMCADELRYVSESLNALETTEPIRFLGLKATAGLFNTLATVVVSGIAAALRSLVARALDGVDL